jgi:Transposase, Mutator family
LACGQVERGLGRDPIPGTVAYSAPAATQPAAAAEDGAGWLAFLRGLVARGLSGVQLVISDAHPGLIAAIGSALPGAAWQRCRSH